MKPEIVQLDLDPDTSSSSGYGSASDFDEPAVQVLRRASGIKCPLPSCGFVGKVRTSIQTHLVDKHAETTDAVAFQTVALKIIDAKKQRVWVSKRDEDTGKLRCPFPDCPFGTRRRPNLKQHALNVHVTETDPDDFRRYCMRLKFVKRDDKKRENIECCDYLFERGKMVQCGDCLLWVHFDCYGLESVDEDVLFLCRHCEAWAQIMAEFAVLGKRERYLDDELERNRTSPENPPALKLAKTAQIESIRQEERKKFQVRRLETLRAARIKK